MSTATDRIDAHTAPDTPETAIPAALDSKLAELEALLRELAPVAIGFSGGVDSTFLAAVCARCIPDATTLVHLDTPFIATPERTSCAQLAAGFGLPFVEAKLDPLDNPSIVRNDADRCYHCKHAVFGRIIELARAHGCATVLDGSNADDATDFRPGTRALRELGVRSPLMEAGWHKDEERMLLRAWGFELWGMPAGACLATRVASGEPLTERKLERIARCEDLLHSRGLQQVRARLMGDVLCIEAAPDDLDRLIALGGLPVAEGVMLPELLMRELIAHAGGPVRRIARRYRHGAMNAPATSQ